MSKAFSACILILGCAGAIFGAAWRYSLTAAPEPVPPQCILLPDEATRRSYLQAQGIHVCSEPPEQTAVTVPEANASSVYESYAALQQRQALPLSAYAGAQATLWSYTVADAATQRISLLCTPDGLLLGAMRYDCTDPAHFSALSESTGASHQ